MFSIFSVNAKEEVTHGGAMRGIAQKRGDALELNSSSLAAGTSVSSAEGKEAVETHKREVLKSKTTATKFFPLHLADTEAWVMKP